MVDEKNCVERILPGKEIIELVWLDVHGIAVYVEMNYAFASGLGHRGEIATDECWENYGMPRL
jgi:hypothetical protein